MRTRELHGKVGANLDDVVAHNVRRLREQQGLTVIELAERMGVGRHLIYDFERPRPGKEQRSFLWDEIVLLCQGLGVTLFELVLPPEDIELEFLAIRSSRDRWAFVSEKETADAANKLGLDDLADITNTNARARLGWKLFGINKPEFLTQEGLKGYLKRVTDEKERRRQIIEAVSEEMYRLVDEAVVFGIEEEE